MMGLWDRFKRIFITETLRLEYGATLTQQESRTGAAVSLGATLTELNRIAQVSARNVTLGASQAITQALHDGKNLIMNLAGAARTYTLPASTGSGARFKFFVGAVNVNNYLIKVANASDIMQGCLVGSADGGATGNFWDTAATDDTITLNGTTTGGAIRGDWIELVDILPNVWAVYGIINQSGVEATPFSATV